MKTKLEMKKQNETLYVIVIITFLVCNRGDRLDGQRATVHHPRGDLQNVGER